MSNGRGGGFFAGFLLGSIVGGAAAVLLAQEETRDLLVGKAREASNMAKDATEDLRGRVEDVAAQWQSSASDLYDRGKQVVEQRAFQRGRRGRGRQEHRPADPRRPRGAGRGQ